MSDVGAVFGCMAGDSGHNESGAAGIDSMPACCPGFALAIPLMTGRVVSIHAA